jgi:hypothetical protein
MKNSTPEPEKVALSATGNIVFSTIGALFLGTSLWIMAGGGAFQISKAIFGAENVTDPALHHDSPPTPSSYLSLPNSSQTPQQQQALVNANAF